MAAYLSEREAYCSRLLRRRRRALSRAAARLHRARLAQSLRAPPLHYAGAGRSRTSFPSSPSSTPRSLRPIPQRDGTRSGTFILVNFARRMILIGGTRYAGEIKKSVFTVMNYLVAACATRCRCTARPTSATRGDVAILFGLSGTGKTTLSSDSHRPLIGDDEHGWSADGVFNFEGGCYAKVIRLSPTAEPEIWAATNHFATVHRERRLRRADARARRRFRRQDRKHSLGLSAGVHSRTSCRRARPVTPRRS